MIQIQVLVHQYNMYPSSNCKMLFQKKTLQEFIIKIYKMKIWMRNQMKSLKGFFLLNKYFCNKLSFN